VSGELGLLRREGRRASAHLDRFLATPKFEAIALSAVFLWSLAAMALIVLSGTQHDYELYVTIWKHILAGGDPWQTTGIPFNAYGPIHTWFAYLLDIGGADESVYSPKIVFGSSFLIVNLWMVLLLLWRNPKPRAASYVAYAVLVPLNYLVIGVAFIDGDNDTLVAALVGLALIMRLRNHLAWAGVLLGLAILMKYYPALLIPFFCLDRRKVRVTPAIAAAVTVMVGLLVTYLKWGESLFNAVTFGAQRGSGSLSVIHFLGTQRWIDPGLNDRLSATNSLMVVGSICVLFLVAYRIRLTWLEGSMLAGLTMVIVYMVGHQQFLLVWIVLLVGLLVEGSRRSRSLVYLSLPLVILMSAYQAAFHVYWWSGLFLEDEARFVRDQVGLPFFITGVATVVASLVAVSRQGKVPADPGRSPAQHPREPIA